jgi:hypothetical protein
MELVATGCGEHYRNKVYRGFVWSVAHISPARVIDIQLCTCQTRKANVVCTDHTQNGYVYIIHKVNKTFWIRSTRNGKKFEKISINNLKISLYTKILLLIYSQAVFNAYCWNYSFICWRHFPSIDHLKFRTNLNQKGQWRRAGYLMRNMGMIKHYRVLEVTCDFEDQIWTVNWTHRNNMEEVYLLI